MATTAAVVLSWFGVRDVVHDAMLDHVQPLPPRNGSEPPEPVSSTSEPPATSTPRTPPESPTPPPSPSSTASSTEPPTTGDDGSEAKRVRGYQLAGGRVVLAVHPDHARLLSAVPNPGYQVRTWRNDQWLRVDMVGGAGRRSSLFATWNGHPPTVRVVEY